MHKQIFLVVTPSNFIRSVLQESFENFDLIFFLGFLQKLDVFCKKIFENL